MACKIVSADIRNGYKFCICTITEYEIYTGLPELQTAFWKEFLEKIEILSFDSTVAFKTAEINKALKFSKQIVAADLFIPAIALSNNLPISTLNVKHFHRIDELILVDFK